jgi:pimeloyl-ACP methyl ester carboxylesterase
VKPRWSPPKEVARSGVLQGAAGGEAGGQVGVGQEQGAVGDESSPARPPEVATARSDPPHGPNAAECAGLFEHAELAVQPGAGHFPWLDDPVWFTWTLAAFPG